MWGVRSVAVKGRGDMLVMALAKLLRHVDREQPRRGDRQGAGEVTVRPGRKPRQAGRDRQESGREWGTCLDFKGGAPGHVVIVALVEQIDAQSNGCLHRVTDPECTVRPTAGIEVVVDAERG